MYHGNPIPEANTINAFNISWQQYNNIYMFPPFSCLGRALRKCCQEGTPATVIAPIWPSQPWFATLLRLSTQAPRLLPRHPSTLVLPHKPTETHPLSHKLQLAAFRVSPHPSEAREYRTTLPSSSANHGARARPSNTTPTPNSGLHFAVQGKQIVFLPMSTTC